MDPDTKIMNAVTYRGMIGDDEKSIPVLLARSQHWGIHFSKYEQRGEAMPVAVVYGWDPSMGFTAGLPLSIGEYEAMGAIRQKPVPLCRCETSDLEVPASAEIVVEGTIPTNPDTYDMEGPFGVLDPSALDRAGSGDMGGRRLRPLCCSAPVSETFSPDRRGGAAGAARGAQYDAADCFRNGVRTQSRAARLAGYAFSRSFRDSATGDHSA